ncbi:S24 family peptidase [Vibrio hepatarius]|uniref:S24 family peptidase n=1 Tax=Vibrio hepatarius TaxID=171383 RepID=UPI001C09792B|nr:S24 family peptidase [Vibrio hepatarius]MBU2897710.1 hypothetical protein [Vibrio hepatarius]
MKTAEEIRVDNARFLAQLEGGISAFASKIDRSVTQTSRFMGSNPTTAIGPKMARHIETCFDKSEGWLDIDHSYGSFDKAKFADNLNKSCETHGIPERGRAAYIQEHLSRKVSLVAIRKWLSGESIPDKNRVEELASIAGTTKEYLYSLPSNSLTEQQVLQEPTPQHRTENVVPITALSVPILSWVQAGAFCNSESQVLPHDCDMILCPVPSASSRTFALRVVGDSMTAQFGKSYPKGTIIYVDPEVEATPGKRVVARTEQGHTFKELAENEFGVRYLIALNPHHQPIFDDGIEVCGVVIGSYISE